MVEKTVTERVEQHMKDIENSTPTIDENPEDVSIMAESMDAERRAELMKYIFENYEQDMGVDGYVVGGARVCFSSSELRRLGVPLHQYDHTVGEANVWYVWKGEMPDKMCDVVSKFT